MYKKTLKDHLDIYHVIDAATVYTGRELKNCFFMNNMQNYIFCSIYIEGSRETLFLKIYASLEIEVLSIKEMYDYPYNWGINDNVWSIVEPEEEIERLVEETIPNIKEYAIPVVYQSYGKVYIHGLNLKDTVTWARKHLNELPLPFDADYIEDSFEIMTDEEIKEMNNEEM